MTALDIPEERIQIERDSNRTLVSIPIITIGTNQDVTFLHGYRAAYISYKDGLRTLGHSPTENVEPLNVISAGVAEIQGCIVLSLDKQYAYIGISNNNLVAEDLVHRIHIATNTITHTFTYGIDTFADAIAIDGNGDIFVGGHGTAAGKDGIELIKLNGDDLTEIWSSTRPGIGNITVDANDNVYLTILTLDGSSSPYDKNVYKYNGSTGAEIWGISTIEDFEDPITGVNDRAWNVAIDSTGRVFVIAKQDGSGSGKNSLYELNAANGAVLIAGDIGNSTPTAFAADLTVLDDDTLLTLLGGFSGNFMRNWTTSGSFVEVTAGNYPVEDVTDSWVHFYRGPIQTLWLADANGYYVYKTNGTFLLRARKVQGPTGIAFPKVVEAIQARMNTSPETFPTEPPESLDLTELTYEDMPCFLAPEIDIPYFDLNGEYFTGDLFWYDNILEGTAYDRMSTGVFQVTADIPVDPPPSNPFYVVWHDTISLSPAMSVQHPDWDQYPGFGGHGGGGLVVSTPGGNVQTGIGNSPKFYTASVFGILQSDGGAGSEPSVYNGNVILRKGPGLFGFFYHFDRSTGFHLIYNIGHMDMDTFTPDADISTRIRAFLEPALETQYAVVDLIDGGGGADQIKIAGDLTAVFAAGVTLKFKNSSVDPNDGTYIVSGSSFDAVNTTINIPTGSFTDDTATGGTVELIPKIDMIYKYSLDVDRDTQLISPDGRANEYTVLGDLGADVIGFAGIISLYPGIRPEWDATTTWAVDDIVAWEGFFYVCILESTNNEPPNATYWTQLSGPPP